MNLVSAYLEHVAGICLDVAPWLLAGLVLAALIKNHFPAELLMRWLGGTGFFPVLKAALVGTPLPLCSCSVLPTAMQLHRSGASRGAVTSFLVATPENGFDSIALSYVLLGPAMTVIRPVAAIVSAVVTGTMAQYVSTRGGRREEQPSGTAVPTSCGGNQCCHGEAGNGPAQELAVVESGRRPGPVVRMGRAIIELWDDLALWLLVGILLAAGVETFVGAEALSGIGSGLWAMLVITLISVPMYICATASTPVAASLLMAGMSPGTVLVFLLAGPATNLASAGILWRELGGRTTIAYLAGVVGCSILAGLLVDLLLPGMTLPTRATAVEHEVFPLSVSLTAAAMLFVLAVKPLRRLLGGQ